MKFAAILALIALPLAAQISKPKELPWCAGNSTGTPNGPCRPASDIIFYEQSPVSIYVDEQVELETDIDWYTSKGIIHVGKDGKIAYSNGLKPEEAIILMTKIFQKTAMDRDKRSTETEKFLLERIRDAEALACRAPRFQIVGKAIGHT